MKTSVPGMIPPYELMAKKAPVVATQYTKAVQAIAAALAYPPTTSHYW